MTKTVTWLKANLFLVAVALAYLALVIFWPSIGLQSIQNSGYYIKEMLMIMPVIFVLTALLDTWVPKETIIKLLGKDSGGTGVVLSFVLGSVSAGPIYAAFPFCTMLHKKGAGVKNLVIILSAWAVIKIPMLLNEAKFLGLTFMALRWVLTILAILIFSWIAAKIVKDEDLPQEQPEEKSGVYIDQNACMGCRVCTQKYPALFQMDGKKATVKKQVDFDTTRLQDTIAACPVNAIHHQDSFSHSIE